MQYSLSKVIVTSKRKANKVLLIHRDVNGEGGYEAAGGILEVNYAKSLAETL